MSARVFNPIVMSELGRLRSSGSIDRVTTASPSVTAMARVRRDLFGPVDHEESRRFVERELAQQQLHDSDRWGYDFLRDMPRLGHHRYSWERIPAESVPDVYAGANVRLIHRPIPKTPAKAPDAADVHHTPCVAQLTVSDLFKHTDNFIEVIAPPPETTPHTGAGDVKQSLITDFMKSRKRAAVSKRITDPSIDGPSPMKISRRIQLS